MKKFKSWKVIIGSIIIIIVIFLAGYLFAHYPNSKAAVVSQIVSIICWGGLGVFLITSYFKDKNREAINPLPTPGVFDSPEDLEFLKKKRNQILASVLLIEVFGSLPSWITNNYSAGFALANINAIFDVIINAALVYFIFALYKNKTALGYLFYLIIFATLGYMVIDISRKEWGVAVTNLLFGFYFIYYIKSPVNRSNYRIANLILIITFIITAIVTTIKG